MVDFHTHTYLCEHAKGMPDDYAAAACAKGFSVLGFSDHAPLPEGLREGVTMFPHQVEHYISMIGEVKDKYKGNYKSEAFKKCILHAQTDKVDILD